MNTKSPAHSLVTRTLFGDAVCSLDCRTFSDWGALKTYFVERYGLEDVSIQLRPDFVNSECIDRLNQIEAREISENEVLLSLSVGLRVSLDVQLIRGVVEAGDAGKWQPRDDYASILTCAKGVFCRTVRDRVVEMMSSRGRLGVVSIFLDAEGRIESCSNRARSFCDANFSASDRVDDFFPRSHWDYLQGAIQLRELVSTTSYKKESLVFCFHQEGGTVDCLLQKMGASGYLLSMALDR